MRIANCCEKTTTIFPLNIERNTANFASNNNITCNYKATVTQVQTVIKLGKQTFDLECDKHTQSEIHERLYGISLHHNNSFLRADAVLIDCIIKYYKLTLAFTHNPSSKI